MRTTVDIDDNLYREAKILAARRGVHLRVLFEEGLRQVVNAPERSHTGRRIQVPLVRSEGRETVTSEQVREAIDRAQLEDDLHRALLD